MAMGRSWRNLAVIDAISSQPLGEFDEILVPLHGTLLQDLSTKTWITCPPPPSVFPSKCLPPSSVIALNPRLH
eukprot:764658-Hanusia_phi.AAC.15